MSAVKEGGGSFFCSCTKSTRFALKRDYFAFIPGVFVRVTMSDVKITKKVLETTLEVALDRKLGPLKSNIDEIMKTIVFINHQYDDLIKKVEKMV